MNIINYKTETSKSVIKCIDLFCGAGGLSLGFLMAGGIPIAGVDSDRDSIETFKSMFPMAEHTYCGKVEDWRPEFKPGAVDVVIGGPPCQGFSLARGLRFVDDPRNRLYKEFISIVKCVNPTWIVMENVQGITNIGGGVILRNIIEDFEEIGYCIQYKIVNMAMYGVPQLRRRAIFVGNKQNLKFEWPNPLCFDPRSNITFEDNLFDNNLKPYYSVNQALGDLNLPVGKYFAHRANSQMRGPRNRDADSQPAFTLRVRGDEFALCEEPATSAFIPGPAPVTPISYMPTQNDLQEYFRSIPPHWINPIKVKHYKKMNATILSGTRKLTVRELARLQAFPDWFEFTGSLYSQSRQIGNAVPPLFAYYLFKQILKYY